ncbi:hypothetical protein JOM56_014116 [Amanita muscaria]
MAGVGTLPQQAREAAFMGQSNRGALPSIPGAWSHEDMDIDEERQSSQSTTLLGNASPIDAAVSMSQGHSKVGCNSITDPSNALNDSEDELVVRHSPYINLAQTRALPPRGGTGPLLKTNLVTRSNASNSSDDSSDEPVVRQSHYVTSSPKRVHPPKGGAGPPLKITPRHARQPLWAMDKGNHQARRDMSQARQLSASREPSLALFDLADTTWPASTSTANDDHKERKATRQPSRARISREPSIPLSGLDAETTGQSVFSVTTMDGHRTRSATPQSSRVSISPESSVPLSDAGEDTDGEHSAMSMDGHQASSASPQLHRSPLSRESSRPLSDRDEADARLISIESKFDVLRSDVKEIKDALLVRPGVTNQRVHRAHVPLEKSSPFPSSRFKESPNRVRDASKTMLQRVVREAMNRCIGINQDNEIIGIALPSKEDTEEYEDDPSHSSLQPSLNPMRPVLDDVKVLWNLELWELLQEDIVKDKDFSATVLMEMKKVFFLRLGRLKRLVRESVPRNTETQEEFERRSGGSAGKNRQRAHTRRKTLYDNRKQITERNKINPNDEPNEAWTILDFVVDTLASHGMSSDESDTDESGKVVYKIKRMPWRSREIANLLRIVDDDRNTANGFGSRRRGNSFRTRVLQYGAPSSRREAPPCLPLNFYDTTWYGTLKTGEKRGLQPAGVVELPTIDQIRCAFM